VTRHAAPAAGGRHAGHHFADARRAGRRLALSTLARWPLTAAVGRLAGARSGGAAIVAHGGSTPFATGTPIAATGAATATGAAPAPIAPNASGDSGATGGAVATAADEPFSFAFIGDIPYGPLEEGILERLLAGLSAAQLTFVLHVGDIKSRLESCSDEMLGHRLAMLDQAPLPLIYVPGDNEWTDCRDPHGDDWNATLGPDGRLRWLREHAFGVDRSLGRDPLAVVRQARSIDEARAAEPRLPENLRWRIGAVHFCSLHVVGSNDGLAGLSGHNRRLAFDSWAARQQANGRWLFECIERAERDHAAAFVIAMHANLRFDRARDDGYRRMRELIAQAAHRFRRPLLLLHGDTHLFRVGRPLAALGLPHLQQVECFGSPFVSSWLRIDWDPTSSATSDGPFRVSSQSA
jgi:hypothetical protein